MRNLLVILCLCGLLATGCAQSLKHVEASYVLSEEVRNGVAEGLFNEAVMLNQAALNEACEKWLLQAELALALANDEGNVSLVEAREVIAKLKTELQTDQTGAMRNFLRLATYMRIYERSHALTGNVDFYLQAQTPLLEKLSEAGLANYDDVKAEYTKWLPALTELREALGRLRDRLTPPVVP